MKITGNTKMCAVFKKAAKLAHGTGTLYDSNTGQFCIWGKALQMVGVKKGLLHGQGDLEDILDDGENTRTGGIPKPILSCAGFDLWDDNESELAVEKACKAMGGRTVGKFRKLLTEAGLKLRK
jgi:hypothetical protein